MVSVDFDTEGYFNYHLLLNFVGVKLLAGIRSSNPSHFAPIS